LICAACTADTTDRPCPHCGADPLLFGRYRYDARLGAGSTGTTWRATDIELRRTVAVKDVALALATDKQVDLVEREVRVLQQLDHPAIPRYIAHGIEGARRTRRLVVVESFVDGRPLEAPVSEADALAILEQLTDILDYLHGLRPCVVHRDIKPANLIRRRDGGISLVDFGSVRDALPGTFGGSTVAGTFGYMAPEQFRGDAGPASDWYAVGVVGWWLLTGIEPRTRMGDVAADFRWRDGLVASPAMITLLERLLAPDPDSRPDGAAAVRVAIRAARWHVPVGGSFLSTLYADIVAFGAPTSRRTPARRSAAADAGLVAAAQLVWLLPLVSVLAVWRWWW
jgi:serine/threonine protein kinase